MVNDGPKMDARISVTRMTRDEFRDFCDGMGMEYDDAVQFIMDFFQQGDEDRLLSGHRLRDKVKTWFQNQESA